MRVTNEPRLPGFGPQIVIRLTDLLREFGGAINALLARTDTPTSISAVTVAASPFSYKAQADGVLSIVGGTVSAVAYIRQGVNTSLGVVTLVPVKRGDSVSITYSVAPTVTFI